MKCHDTNQTVISQNENSNENSNNTPIILVGNPNVGKSVLFGALTGRRVTVSNYPGTTVEVTQGNFNLNGHPRPIIDTPGINSIVPFSDDERVTRDILLTHNPATIVQVVDTKNLRRGLLIGLELAEAQLPFVLSLNMADEAKSRGIHVDINRLAEILGIPIVSTIATQNIGLQTLTKQLESASPAICTVEYPPLIEQAIAAISPHLPSTTLPARALALMILAGDDAILSQLKLTEATCTTIKKIRQKTIDQTKHPLVYLINQQRLNKVDSILKKVLQHKNTKLSFSQRLGQWMTHPIVGWPILGLILYLVYLFVGVLGAGTLVDFLESTVFEGIVNPWVANIITTLIPITFVQDFLVGDYGLVTMALTYSLAIVLPIVSTFFLAFSLLEDSGYLPRLAVMLNRAFKVMGLNGKAVLPMILGLGCTTMATMTTRILESRKERLQVTLLLALGVPCSAQLGVILGMIADLGTTATLIWGSVVVATLLAVGYLSAQVIPGEKSEFILELPPIRLPSLKNIILKTLARLEWYAKEVIPIFALGTAVLFILDKLNLLQAIERFLAPIIVKWLNLPVEVTGTFLVGFLRRDYGAAGLFALSRDGLLSPVQVLVSLVIITLFMPCIANLLMIVKEYGKGFAIKIGLFIFPFAIIVGGILNQILKYFNILQ